MTSGRQRATASATAAEPSICLSMGGLPISSWTWPKAASAAATLPSPALPGKRSRIAAVTDSSRSSPVSAAKPPSSAALGSGRPRCPRASSVAGTVERRSGRKPSTNSSSPSSSKPRLVLISR